MEQGHACRAGGRPFQPKWGFRPSKPLEPQCEKWRCLVRSGWMLTLTLTLAVAVSAAPALAGNSPPGDDPESGSGFGWALVSGGSTMATDLDDWQRLHDLKADDDHFLMVRFGRDEYVIHDARVLERADDLVEPIRKLGQQAREMASRWRDAKSGSM